MLFYSLQSCLRQIPVITQTLGCSWHWHEVDRLPGSLEWLTREVFRYRHCCGSDSLYFCSHWLKTFFFFSLQRSACVLLLNVLDDHMGSGCSLYMATQYHRNICTSCLDQYRFHFAAISTSLQSPRTFIV